jgi:hypothetical protein
MTIDLLMTQPRMAYTTRAGASYFSNEHGIVTVAANHTHELVAMGGVPLPPVFEQPDGSTVAWTDPRIHAAKPSN